ncbi:hypothetical protein AB0E01_00095 [Nocardia vinacea]|uniref:hypothetical protein n=1 Tax=Nocardia vinacea TaxID=96468 RepID=UPI0033DB6F75
MSASAFRRSVIVYNAAINAAHAISDRIAADVAATAARRETLTFLFQRIAAFMERFPTAGLAIHATIMGAVSMGGVVAGAQYAQIVQGHGKRGRRTSMGWGQVWVAAAAAGGAGLGGAMATRAMLPMLTPIGANATTQLGRSTGRAVAVVLASATGGAAGGAAGAVAMSALTHSKLNLAEMMLMGAGSGAVGGFGAAMRATRAMGTVRPPEQTATEVGRSLGGRNDSWRDRLPVREPSWNRPHSNADTARPSGETIPEIDGRRPDSPRDGLPERPAPDWARPRTAEDGHAPWQSPKETIDEIGKSLEGEFSKLDKKGGTPPRSDPDQPPSGTPQSPPASPTSPGGTPEPSHGWDPDRALQELIKGNYRDAPHEPMVIPASPSSTNLPGTAQFQSSRPDYPQMGLVGPVLAADGQPNATPVMTMSANPHAENNTHFGTAKDLGGTGGGNGPSVTAGPPAAHGGSPSGGGPGPHSHTPGRGPGEPPPDPDEASIMHLDFEPEPVGNEPATPAGTSLAATHTAGATPVEPMPGNGPGSATPTSAEANSPTAQPGPAAGPSGAPAQPTPAPAASPPANAPAPQAKTPTPHATPRHKPIHPHRTSIHPHNPTRIHRPHKLIHRCHPLTHRTPRPLHTERKPTRHSNRTLARRLPAGPRTTLQPRRSHLRHWLARRP